VADLFHGDHLAGKYAFEWDGRTAEGAPAREGIYFLRAAVGNHAAAKKLVLIRREASSGSISPP
jgi:flagellar hook assembly protein FlgD